MSKREFKSSVFSMLLEEPRYALDVYNTLNGTCYADSGDVCIQKLDGRILLSVRNDASFIIDFVWNLYEHQSTFNPNMPLRFMLYFAEMIMDCVREKKYDLDLACTVYNINPGYNEEIQRSSKVMSGYTTFVEKVRKYEKKKELKEAIEQAIDECIAEDVLKDFFEKRRDEIMEVAVLDFTYEKRLEYTARDSREEGIEEGLEKGIKKGIKKGIEKGLE